MPRLAGIANFNPDKDIPSLSGKVVLVTGGTAGLGKQSIQALAKHDPEHIYFTGRNQKAADAVMNDIKAENSGVGLTFLEMDFSSLESVRASINQFAHDRLDILMCNAGVMAAPPAVSKDGFEIHFAINHLAHAMIIRELLPVLTRTAEMPNSDVRVVCLTSEGWKGHPPSGISYDKVRTEKGGMPIWLLRYGQSKFANLVYASELGRRFPKIMAVSVHPGVVKTDLVNSLSFGDSAFLRVSNFILGTSILTPEEGVLNQLWTAVGATRNELVNGAYYKPVGVLSNGDVSKDKMAMNEEVAHKLWTWTSEILDSI
ncbi:NAD(P)-binding protein [Trichoderma sp. SZMC 28012]